ncbi:MAG: SIMPL domain-containing protein, partial [Bacteroidales bacterium]|nr:SIMPL domain-containing protein [Bacteroidales bacterium]
FLQKGGITEEEISVSIPQISDKFANEYGSNDRTFRYISTNVITVCTDKVDEVLDLMSKQSLLLKKGIVTSGERWENPVEFKYEGLNDIKPEMIEEATRNAREAADKFAKDSESSLGKIKTANQGTFTISDRDSNTPHIKKVRVVTSVTYYLKN